MSEVLRTVGHIDSVEYTPAGTYVTGWAASSIKEAGPLRIRIEDSVGTVLASGFALHPREDVVKAGYEELNCGFRLSLRTAPLSSEIIAFAGAADDRLLPGTMQVDRVKLIISNALNDQDFSSIDRLIQTNPKELLIILENMLINFPMHADSIREFLKNIHLPTPPEFIEKTAHILIRSQLWEKAVDSLLTSSERTEHTDGLLAYCLWKSRTDTSSFMADVVRYGISIDDLDLIYSLTVLSKRDQGAKEQFEKIVLSKPDDRLSDDEKKSICLYNAMFFHQVRHKNSVRKYVDLFSGQMQVRINLFFDIRYEDISAASEAAARLDWCWNPKDLVEVFFLDLLQEIAPITLLHHYLSLVVFAGKREAVLSAEGMFGDWREAHSVLQYHKALLLEQDEDYDQAAEVFGRLRAGGPAQKDSISREIYCLAKAGAQSNRIFSAATAAEGESEEIRDFISQIRKSVRNFLSQKAVERANKPARIVFDYTHFAGMVFRGNRFGGIDISMQKLAYIFLSSDLFHGFETIFINYKSAEGIPVILSREAISQMLERADELTEPSLWQEFTPDDKVYFPGENDVYIGLGANWIPDRLNSVARSVKRAGGKVVACIYDLLPLTFPEVAPEVWRIRFGSWADSILRLSDLVMCISHYTEREVEWFCRTYDLPMPKTKVIYLADEKRGGKAKTRRDGTLPELLLTTPAKANSNYALCVSSFTRRKNQVRLIEAWDDLARRGIDVPSLIFVGPEGETTDIVREKAQNALTRDKLILLNHVTDEQLEDLLQNCLFTVFPSTCEGWGMPVRESIRAGKVCFASNVTSVPEAGGEFAIYFDPSRAKNIADAIAPYLENRARLSAWEKKLAQAPALSWKAVADDLLTAVADALDLQRSGVFEARAGSAAAKSLVMLCPSLGKRCGIAEYTAHLTKSLRREGWTVKLVSTVDQMVDAVIREEYPYFLIQHEYGLYDAFLQHLAGPDSTDELIDGIREIKESAPWARGATLMHTVVASRDKLVERTFKIRNSGIPTVCFQSGGPKAMPDLTLMELGIPPIDTSGLQKHDRRGKGFWIGTFGILSPHKDIWSTVKVCEETHAGLRGVLFTEDANLKKTAERLMSDSLVAHDVSFDYETDETVLSKLQECDVIYIPQRGIDYFATSATVRFAMVLDKPIIVSRVPQFDDLEGSVILADAREAVAEINRLKSDPDYYALWSQRTKQFRDSHGMGPLFDKFLLSLRD